MSGAARSAIFAPTRAWSEPAPHLPAEVPVLVAEALGHERLLAPDEAAVDEQQEAGGQEPRRRGAEPQRAAEEHRHHAEVHRVAREAVRAACDQRRRVAERAHAGARAPEQPERGGPEPQPE